MTSWIFKIYPHTETPFKQFSRDGVIAIGWADTNKNDIGKWKEKYPVQPSELWTPKVRPNANKKTPNATPSFEILLGKMQPGDLVLAVHEDGGRSKVLGVGQLGESPHYKYIQKYPPKDEDQAKRRKQWSCQPHTLAPVEWKARPVDGGIPAFVGVVPPGLIRADAVQSAQIENAWSNWPGGSPSVQERARPQKTAELNRAKIEPKGSEGIAALGADSNLVTADSTTAEPAVTPDIPSTVTSSIFPDQVEDSVHAEGTVTRVLVNRYERDQMARAECIRHFGPKCQVCGFDFGTRFGSIGEGFIHVHHLVPISTVGKDYQVKPEQDLAPVCPNCHAMLHRKSPEPFGIEELRHILSSKNKI